MFVVVSAEISKAFIKYRKENNLTQVQLAEILGVNQVMVSKLESGDYNPTVKKVFQFSWKLTNSPDFFVNILKNVEEGIKRHSGEHDGKIHPLKSIRDIENLKEKLKEM